MRGSLEHHNGINSANVYISTFRGQRGKSAHSFTSLSLLQKSRVAPPELGMGQPARKGNSRALRERLSKSDPNQCHLTPQPGSLSRSCFFAPGCRASNSHVTAQPGLCPDSTPLPFPPTSAWRAPVSPRPGSHLTSL